MNTPHCPTTLRHGGICRTQELLELGWTHAMIRKAVSQQTLQRLRIGWFALPDSDPRVTRAVSAHGALACASAIAFHGGWDVTAGTVHVRTDHNHSTHLRGGLRSCRSTRPSDDLAPAAAVDDLEVALRCAWRCLDPEQFVVCVDSLVHRRLMSMEQVRQVLAGIRGSDEVLARCDRAESGTESMVRLRLRRLGIRLRTQVEIPGVGRVDMLVGNRLVIEVDSRSHHTGEANYRKDRERDLTLISLGYTVIRLTYEQVLYKWEAVEPHIRATVHRLRRAPALVHGRG